MIILREADEADADDYVRLQKDISLGVFKIDEESLSQTWTSMLKDNGRIAYTVLTEDTNDFCGYCAVKDVNADKPEIEIELLKKYHSKGIGFEVLYKMMTSLSAKDNISCFIALIEPDNYASQKLMYKLGGVPASITKSFFLKEHQTEEFENSNLHLLDDRLIQIAKDFGVEPKKLLSHILVFDISSESLLKSGHRKSNGNIVADADRKISVEKRRFYNRGFVRDVLKILESNDNIDELKASMISYLEEELNG